MSEGSNRAEGGAPAPVSALPCLNRNNCCSPSFNVPHSQHAKTAYALSKNIESLVDRVGLERVGFVTLTTPESVTPKEIQRRYKSAKDSGVFNGFLDAITVLERSPKGRVHLHLLVTLRDDIRTGVDFEAFGRGDYASAPPALRKLWKHFRTSLPKYGFGRHELLPVKSCSNGISRYVGKYIAKHVGQRIPEDKGVRLVRYTVGARPFSGRFSWNSSRSRIWRQLVGLVARDCGIKSLDGFVEHFGRSWALFLRDAIENGPATVRSTPRRERVWTPRRGEPLGECLSPVEQGRRAFRDAVKAHGSRVQRKRYKRLYAIVEAAKAKRERDEAWERSLTAEWASGFPSCGD